ncbi:hypothetical protein K3175_05870 [Qipengyuania sp. GH1]|uniref:hypothetical protein n=1 Tax=Qipengyuania aestuarii TaxID=2867241 RepID=UPI001C87218F|nr:hypothetical protein [Qipengyuania aestuarii]MBX7535181.1 hypothetical protein [Qipengyuania aestuarii]
MTEQVEFTDDPEVRDTDDEKVVELIFYTQHRMGGSSKASMLVPRSLAGESWAIERARTAGATACTKVGGGGAMSVTILDGW